jgi:hypothetical protein
MSNTGGGKDALKREIMWICFIHVLADAWIVFIHSQEGKCCEISGNGMGQEVISSCYGNISLRKSNGTVSANQVFKKS